MPVHNDFGGNADERASDETIPRAPLRARTSSRKRGTSQARCRLSPKSFVPAKTYSRRKVGAETTKLLSPKDRMSQRSSSPERAGRANLALSPTPSARGPSSQPVGQKQFAIQGSCAGGPTLQPVGQQKCVTHSRRAGGPIESVGELQNAAVTHRGNVLSDVIDELREQWKRRQMWHRAEKSLTLQAKSMCRRLVKGDKKEAEVLYKRALTNAADEQAVEALFAMQPLLDARKGIEIARLAVEKRLLVLTKLLSVAPWIETVRGVGALSLAGIVGEAGDLSLYANPAKLWKRMGLAVIGGERQRKKEGEAGIVHGYNPARRSLMWTIGDCIIRAGGPLKKLYDERKAIDLEKTMIIAADPELKKRFSRSGKYAPLAHAHNRAKRYIEKRLLLLLWRAWMDAMNENVPSKEH